MKEDIYGRGSVAKWRWVDGRQGAGYKIFYIWDLWFDLVLIRYPDGSHIDPHRDPVPAGMRHHRVNFTIRRPRAGGQFRCPLRHVILKLPGVIWFRPDLGTHSVSRVSGERWIFSVGWVLGRRAAGSNDGGIDVASKE